MAEEINGIPMVLNACSINTSIDNINEQITRINEAINNFNELYIQFPKSEYLHNIPYVPRIKMVMKEVILTNQ